MFVSIKRPDNMKVVDIAKFVGCAPCQLLSVNRCNETEFYAKSEIILPVSTPTMIYSIDD